METSVCILELKKYRGDLHHSESAQCKDRLYGELDCVCQMREGWYLHVMGAVVDMGAIIVAVMIGIHSFVVFPGVAERHLFVKSLLFLHCNVDAELLHSLMHSKRVCACG